MMQIGGVDNLVLKQVKLPSDYEQEEKKVQLQNDDRKVIEDTKVQTGKDNGSTDEAEKAMYGDVVGRSSDGDTTRVKQDAIEALETGMVFQKDEREGNLMEWSRDQLTTMLDRGDITNNEYEREIARRDEIMEKDEESAAAKTNAEMIEKQRKEAEEKAKEAAKERLEEMQDAGNKEKEIEGIGVQNGKEDENRVNTQNEEEDDNISRLENGMNMLAAGERSLEIEEDAVNIAAQNGRSEIIDQILNPEDGSLKVIIQ